MPYRRRYGKRRYRRRRYRRRAPNSFQNAAKLAYTAWKGVRYLKGLVNSELLCLDAPSTGTISNIGSLTHICNIAQGDGVAGRTGNSLLAKTIYIKMQITKEPAVEFTRVRLMLVRDNQQITDTAPTIANVLGTTDILNAPLNVETLGRFTVLYDRVFNLTSDKPIMNPRVYLKNLNTHVRYNGPLGTDQQKNAYYWIQIADQPTLVPDYVRFIRFRYHDN